MSSSTSSSRPRRAAGEEVVASFGVPLARGPMGGDQYTQIHNHVFRDSRLSAKAMGIFGHLTTHVEGWETDAKAIARAMKDGRDAIATGLQELERYHYLIRHQPRNADGTVGKPVWFYTDLPAQIRALGITDESVVLDRVRTAFEEWMAAREENPRSGPEPANPVPVLTSGNVDAPTEDATDDQRPVDNLADSAYLPSSAPVPDLPVPADPVPANPPHKKNNYKKTKPQNTNPEGPAPLEPPAPIADATGPKKMGSRTSTRDSKRKTRSNPLTAHARKTRARELAGPAALAAITADAAIDIDDLANVIARSATSRLTQTQAVSRATALAAWERQASGAPHHQGDTSSGQVSA